MGVLSKLFDWAISNLPGLFLGFNIGYSEGSENDKELEKKLLDSKLKEKILDNEIANDKNFDSISSASIVDKIARGDDN